MFLSKFGVRLLRTQRVDVFFVENFTFLIPGTVYDYEILVCLKCEVFHRIFMVQYCLMRTRCAVSFEENAAVVCVLMQICDYTVFAFCRTKVICGTQYCGVFLL